MAQSHHTQWAAQFAVASELCKRRYEVALTMGNHPTIDLMVRSPTGHAFFVDVKGVYKPNFFLIKAQPLKADLFYILACVPEKGANDFFIMTHGEVLAEIDIVHAKARAHHAKKGKVVEGTPMPGVGWKAAQAHKALEAWSKLPA